MCHIFDMVCHTDFPQKTWLFNSGATLWLVGTTPLIDSFEFCVALKDSKLPYILAVVMYRYIVLDNSFYVYLYMYVSKPYTNPYTTFHWCVPKF